MVLLALSHCVTRGAGAGLTDAWPMSRWANSMASLKLPPRSRMISASMSPPARSVPGHPHPEEVLALTRGLSSHLGPLRPACGIYRLCAIGAHRRSVRQKPGRSGSNRMTIRGLGGRQRAIQPIEQALSEFLTEALSTGIICSTKERRNRPPVRVRDADRFSQIADEDRLPCALYSLLQDRHLC